MTTFSVRILSATLAAAAASLCCVAPALADADSPNSARIGLYSVFYHVSADDLSGPFVPPGSHLNLNANNVETLYLAYVRTLSSHFDVELTAGYPPLQKTVGKGPATLGSVPYDGQVIATARWLAPTVLLEYKFLSESSKWRPYIGVGVNYTAFYDRDSTAQGNAIGGGPTRLSLTSSVGPAGTVGVAYNIAGHWHAYASYSISKVSTDLSADTGGEIRTTHINFGPQALVVAAGYSF
jgi:outer membrane protein